MAEIKLICPGCEAEYLLPRSAIPAAGREVECSRCGLVWQAQRPDVAQPLDLASFTLPAADRQPVIPPASRRLAPEVLNILKEEVEHERRQRAAGKAAPDAAPAAPAHPDADWPATTVVVPAGATRAMTPTPQPPMQLSEPAPLVIRHPVATRPSAVTRPPAAVRRAWAYRLGFGLMVALAAACVAIYVLAPQSVGQGGLGDRLAELRDGMDRIRLWLDAQTARLRG